MFRNPTILFGDSAEFCVVPEMPMIVLNNVLLSSHPSQEPPQPQIPRDSGNLDDSLSKYTMFLNHPVPQKRIHNREVPGMPMIVFNNVLCFVILQSLSSLRRLRNREFRRIPHGSGNANDSL